MTEFEPVLLANIGNEASHTLPASEAAGGYQALKKAIADMAPGDVLGMVKDSGLRGRGGAGP